LTTGSNDPYRLSLTATQSGQAGNMIVDTSQIGGLSLQQLAQGQNALLALGNASGTSSNGSSTPVIISSSSNTFSSVLPGASLEINSPTGQPVSITVGNDGTNVSGQLQTFVKDYNSFRSQLTTDTAYNTTTETGAILTDDPVSFQLDEQTAALVSGQFASTGPVRSLADVGITVNSDGSLSFDQDTFDSAWSSNPTAVQNLFTTAKTGVSAQFNTLITQLAGQTNSLLTNRATAFANQISENQATINQMNQRLNDEQNLLYTQFYNMDLAISKLKSSQNVISSLDSVAPDFGANSSSSG
jgi:flagellar hook-associated protein 2